MKATGVVRRIDDLGRIVIPKEIRRTLRISEGSPLEIFTEKDGEIVLKKYSPIGELSEFASNYADTLAKTTGHIACITDKDTIIAVAGGLKKDLLEQSISKELEEVIENKERVFHSQVIYPIVSDGDSVGSVVLMSKEPNKKMTDTELKVVQSAAGILGSQLEI